MVNYASGLQQDSLLLPASPPVFWFVEHCLSVLESKGRVVRPLVSSMASHQLANYLRTYRRKSGLTQREVAFLLGRKDGAQFSRYEKRRCLPPLRMALACEAIFHVPVAKLFGGVHDEVRREVSERIDALGTRLEERKNHGRHKLLIQRKLTWIQERLHRVVFSID